jgi:hypothetical protein
MIFYFFKSIKKNDLNFNEKINMVKDIDYYINLSAINRIKAYIKCRYRKVFPEYEAEVDRYLLMVKLKIKLS